MPRLRSIVAVFGLTTIVAVAAATRHHYQMMGEGRPPSYLTWPHAMIQEMPFFYLWALAVPVVLWFTRRVARVALPPVGLVAAHVGFAAVVILLQGLLHTVFMELLSPSPEVTSLGQRIDTVLEVTFWRLPTQLVTYGALLGTVLAYDYYRRFMDRELGVAAMATELAEARLGALRAQLHPHFVFNALNSVAMLVRGQRNTEAVDTIAGLSDLLRDALEDGHDPEIPLRQEIDFVQRYLAIERIRFGDRLRVTFDIEPVVADARVPRLLLQPLVENAMRHGIGRRSSAGQIVIRAARAGDRLLIHVDDDGPGPTAPGQVSHGVGLTNTRKRLATLYGDAASVTLASGPTGGARASVVLPYVVEVAA